MDLIVTFRRRGMSHLIRYCDLPLAEATELRDYWHERSVRDIQTTREEGMDEHDDRN